MLTVEGRGMRAESRMGQTARWARTLPERGACVLRWIGAVMERHRWWSLAVLLLLYGAMVLVEAHARPLLNDEFYTIHIARMPTLRAMWGQEREIDLHPPLHYLLQRLVLHLPGPLWLISRLPSMVAGAIATAMLFVLVSRRLGSVLGWVSAAVLWTGPAAAFFWSNRPYMIWVALLLTMTAAYLRAVRKERRWWEVWLVFLLSALMVSDLLISIASLGAFAAAEALRAWRRRKIDVPLWLALFAPTVGVLGFMYQMQHLEANAFPKDQIPTVGWALSMYLAQVTQMFFLISVTAVIGAYLQAGYREKRVEVEGSRTHRLGEVEGTVYVGWLLVPVVLMVAAVLRHVQYWERYSMCSILGLAGLVPWMVYRRLPRIGVLGPLLLLVFVGTTVDQVAGDAQRNDPKPGRIVLRALGSGMPVVAANPMTFMEMSHREPQSFATRVYYLTDRAEAERISGYTLFENEDKIARMLDVRSHAEPAGLFFADHRQFWLIADPKNHAEWLLRSLVEHDATVAWKGKLQPGYDDSDVYLVTLAGK